MITMQRNDSKAMALLHDMKEVATWISRMIPSMSSSSDLMSDLLSNDGELFLELASQLSGKRVAGKQTPQAFRTVANINSFIDTCVSLGISREKLFEPADLVGAKRNDARVLKGLKEVMQSMKARVTHQVKQIEKPKVSHQRSNAGSELKKMEKPIAKTAPIEEKMVVKTAAKPIEEKMVVKTGTKPAEMVAKPAARIAESSVPRTAAVSAPASVPAAPKPSVPIEVKPTVVAAAPQPIEREVEVSPRKREYVLERVPSASSVAVSPENKAPKVKTPKVRKVTAIAQLPPVKSRGPLGARSSNEVEPALTTLLSESRYRPLRSRVQLDGVGGVVVEGTPVSLTVREGELYIKRGSGLQAFRTWLDRRFFVMPEQKQKEKQAAAVEFDETEHLRSLLAKNTLFL